MARYREELSILRGQPFMERLAPIMSTAIFDGSNPSEVECVFRHVKLAHRHTTKLVLCQELRLIVLHEGSSQSRQRCHCSTNRSESSSLLVFVMSIDPIAPDHGCPRRQGRGRDAASIASAASGQGYSISHRAPRSYCPKRKRAVVDYRTCGSFWQTGGQIDLRGLRDTGLEGQSSHAPLAGATSIFR